MAAAATDRAATGDKSQPVLGAGGDEEQAEDAPALGFPVFATKNTTRVAGADPIAYAAGAARAVYPPAPTRAARAPW